MKPDEPAYERQDRYRGFINYEGILSQQQNRIAQFRSDKNMELFEESVDTLVFMLPLELREKAIQHKKDNNIRYDISDAGKALYDELWCFCNELLEKHNLIFKSTYIKTYE